MLLLLSRRTEAKKLTQLVLFEGLVARVVVHLSNLGFLILKS